MKYLLLIPVVLFSVVALSSCSSYVPSRYYLINTDPEIEKAGTRYDLSIEMGDIRAPSRYQQPMVYRGPDYEVGFYEYSKWAELPADMVRMTLVNAVRRSGLFAGVDPLNISSTADLYLLGEIIAFDQDVTDDGNYAHCTILLELLKGKDGASIWTHEADSRVAQEGKDRFVAAMTEAVREAVAASVRKMEKSGALSKCAAEKQRAARKPETAP